MGVLPAAAPLEIAHVAAPSWQSPSSAAAPPPPAAGRAPTSTTYEPPLPPTPPLRGTLAALLAPPTPYKPPELPAHGTSAPQTGCGNRCTRPARAGAGRLANAARAARAVACAADDAHAARATAANATAPSRKCVLCLERLVAAPVMACGRRLSAPASALDNAALFWHAVPALRGCPGGRPARGAPAARKLVRFGTANLLSLHPREDGDNHEVTRPAGSTPARQRAPD